MGCHQTTLRIQSSYFLLKKVQKSRILIYSELNLKSGGCTMEFVGKFDLNDKESFPQAIEKPSYSSDNLTIQSGNAGYSAGDTTVFLFGSITEIFSEGYVLHEYRKKQERLILELFRKHAVDFIGLLDGYFLILLYDKPRKTFYIFNNRYSNTYCYYHLSKDRIIFADKLKTLLKIFPHRPELNRDILSLFLNASYSYSEKTAFKDMYRMIPGFYLKIREGKIEHERYSQMNFNRKPVKDLQEDLDIYERLWRDAIKNFIENNGTKNLGSALSGGNDTTWVVWNASKVHNKPVHTYTCQYQYDLFNESEKAIYVTKKCDGIHHKISITPEDLDLLPEIIRIAEEPVLSTSLPIYKMMKEGRNDIDTLLVGDGGNNIYHHLFPVSEIHRYIHFMPPFVRKFLYGVVDVLARTTRWERLWELRYPMHAFSFKNFYDNFYKNLICYRHFDSAQRRELLKPEFLKEFREEDQLGPIPIRKETFDDDLIHSRFVFGNMQYVMTFHEKFAKELGVKVFAPYQSKRIMDFLCSLPKDMLFRGNTFQRMTNTAKKMYFQKLSLKRHFPADFVEDTGQPFDQPFHGLLENRPRVVELLFNRLKKRGWYNNEYLDKLYREHKQQQQHEKIYCRLENHGYRIMALLALEIWCIEFLDNDPGRSGKKIPLEEYLAQEK